MITEIAISNAIIGPPGQSCGTRSQSLARACAYLQSKAAGNAPHVYSIKRLWKRESENENTM